MLDSVHVEQLPEMMDAGDYPGPIRVGRGDGANLGGLSDHDPINSHWILRAPPWC
jgi:hypothetical protein